MPGSQAFRSSRWRTRNPYPRDTAVPATKYGRKGSKIAARPAPLTPRATATSGPAQQSAEPMAAATPVVAATTVLPTGDAKVLQRLQDGAVVSGAPRGARRRQPAQGAPDAPEITDPSFHQFDLLPGFVLHRSARRPAADSKREQLLYFTQREAEVLSVLDEPEPGYSILGVLPVTRRGPARSGEKASPLVVANGLDMHVGGRGHLTDGERHALPLLRLEIRLNPVRRYGVKGGTQGGVYVVAEEQNGGRGTRTPKGLRPAVFKTAALPVRSSPPGGETWPVRRRYATAVYLSPL